MDETCPKTEALSARLDDQLGARERTALDDHLAGCPLCLARFAELQQLHAALQSLASETLGFDLAEVVRGRLGNEVARQRTPRTRRHWLDLIPLGIGAAASLTLGLSAGLAVTAVGSVAVAPPIAVMSVFAPIAPGGLCLDALACTPPRVLTGNPLL